MNCINSGRSASQAEGVEHETRDMDAARMFEMGGHCGSSGLARASVVRQGQNRDRGARPCRVSWAMVRIRLLLSMRQEGRGVFKRD